VEGGGQQIFFADEGGGVVAFGEDFDSRAGFHDPWGTDVDHLERSAWEFGVGGDDGAVDLASVGVALDGGVEDGEAFLRGIEDFLGQKDAAGAGTEGRLLADEALEGIEEAVAGEELEEGGGFAAGNDEAVNVGQLFRLADEDGFGSGVAEGCCVGIEISLNGEDADDRFFGAGQIPLPLFFTGIVYFQYFVGVSLYGDRLFSMV
jgi:hypothetical protein